MNATWSLSGTPTRPELVWEAMHSLCRRMSVISEVSAASLGGRRSAPGSREPKGSNCTMGQVWWGYFEHAPDDRERRQVLMKAQIAYGQATARSKRRPSRMTTEERDEWLVTAYPGQPAEYVALAERISVTSARRTRRKYGYKPGDGTDLYPDRPYALWQPAEEKKAA